MPFQAMLMTTASSEPDNGRRYRDKDNRACSEVDDDDEVDSEDDDEWSGENDEMDATIIAAVNGDLALAAVLIPFLHRDLRSAVQSKVENWQYHAAAGENVSTTGNSSAGGNGSNSSQGESPSGNKKRRRSDSRPRGRKDEEDDDEDNGGDDGGIDGDGHDLPGSPNQALPLLACPFYKRDPQKYNIQHITSRGQAKKTDYRSCAGPGFKSIQRLK